MRLAFIISMAMVMHTTAQDAAPAPAPVSGESPAPASGPAPAPFDREAPAPAPAPSPVVAPATAPSPAGAPAPAQNQLPRRCSEDCSDAEAVLGRVDFADFDSYCENEGDAEDRGLQCLLERESCRQEVHDAVGLEEPMVAREDRAFSLMMCTAQSRQTTMEAMLTNHTQCTEVCGANAVATFGEYMQLTMRDHMRLEGAARMRMQRANTQQQRANAAAAPAPAAGSAPAPAPAPVGGRRLDGHEDLRSRAVMTRFLCPLESVVRCVTSTPACAVAGEEEEDGDGDGDVEWLDHCNSSLAVTLTMELTVEDPQAFVDNPDSAAAVAAGIANATGVDLEAVEVELSVARRLSGQRLGSRRLSGTVTVTATIQAADASSVTALQASVNAIPAAAMTEALNAALEDVGVTVTVASLTAAAAPAAGSGGGAPEVDDVQRGDGAAFKAAVASKVVVGLLAPLIFLSNFS